MWVIPNHPSPAAPEEYNCFCLFLRASGGGGAASCFLLETLWTFFCPSAKLWTLIAGKLCILCLHLLLKNTSIFGNVFQAPHWAFFQAPYSKREAPRNSPFTALLISVERSLIIDGALKAGLASMSERPDWGEVLLSRGRPGPLSAW